MVKREGLKCLTQMMGYAPQNCEIGRITAFAAILLGRKPYIKWDACSNDFEIVNSVIKKLGFEDLSLRFIDEMNGGELQCVSIP